eukprot:GHVU01031614.1.p1 GENE.GHVU01031614.1~~GHVU01031614.1.p1  ORF type:complete len:109 (-),score=2.59 GHVU01031614.1:391-717(-)
MYEVRCDCRAPGTSPMHGVGELEKASVVQEPAASTANHIPTRASLTTRNHSTVWYPPRQGTLKCGVQPCSYSSHRWNVVLTLSRLLGLQQISWEMRKTNAYLVAKRKS